MWLCCCCQCHRELLSLEQELEELQEACKLFEVSSVDFGQLRACRRRLCVLKHLWDLMLCVQVIHVYYSVCVVGGGGAVLLLRELCSNLRTFCWCLSTQTSITGWRLTHWRDANVDLMDAQLQRFTTVSISNYIN